MPDPDLSVNRTMKKVVISLGAGDTSLVFQHNILMSLPEYTQIFLLLPESNLGAVEGELKKQPYGPRTHLVPFTTRTVSRDGVYMLFS